MICRRVDTHTSGCAPKRKAGAGSWLFGSSRGLSLRQLLVSNGIYKRWNNLCTRLPLMLGDIPAASVIRLLACIDMRRAQCSVLACSTTARFSHASSLRTNRRTLASNQQDCVGYVHLIGSQKNSGGEKERMKFSIQTKRVLSEDSKRANGPRWVWTGVDQPKH